MFKKNLSMKQNITISSEDAEFIEFAYKLCNSAKYPSFTKVTEVYNRVYNKQLSSTSCAQCIRQRILELKATLDRLNKEILEDKQKQDDKINDDKVATDKKDEKQDDKVNDETKSRRGRKNRGLHPEAKQAEVN